jgi:hypothetical protein
MALLARGVPAAVSRLLSRDEVIVVVDPSNPKKAFLRDLFAD